MRLTQLGGEAAQYKHELTQSDAELTPFHSTGAYSSRSDAFTNLTDTIPPSIRAIKPDIDAMNPSKQQSTSYYFSTAFVKALNPARVNLKSSST